MRRKREKKRKKARFSRKMRTKSVTFGGKKLRVEESRISELEEIVGKLFPESKGKITDINLDAFMGQIGFDLFYDKIPVLFPGLTVDDVKNAYPSEIEALLEAFLDVNFSGVKKLIGPLMNLLQIGIAQPGTPLAGSPQK